MKVPPGLKSGCAEAAASGGVRACGSKESSSESCFGIVANSSSAVRRADNTNSKRLTADTHVMAVTASSYESSIKSQTASEKCSNRSRWLE
eukprot:CAMPEP_0119335386 /NCGR_PEP_ID=MMETSP1333-20130426/89481_1 /TAXON_ID=418940 /ORGANISM="Scyphosphaera apsteinii, Strain RCC1455" /LENGTH=90 /DNA_ID=CAMNT_0007345929 /DNA_START=205 /DNA_END=477 /DNA_ORIENTATION=+